MWFPPFFFKLQFPRCALNPPVPVCKSVPPPNRSFLPPPLNFGFWFHCGGIFSHNHDASSPLNKGTKHLPVHLFLATTCSVSDVPGPATGTLVSLPHCASPHKSVLALDPFFMISRSLGGLAPFLRSNLPKTADTNAPPYDAHFSVPFPFLFRF